MYMKLPHTRERKPVSTFEKDARFEVAEGKNIVMPTTEDPQVTAS